MVKKILAAIDRSKYKERIIAYTTLQLFDLYRKGYASRVSSEVQEILGRRPIPFSQFVKERSHLK